MKRQDFPVLKKGLIYLDNASTTQKPTAVIERVTKYYRKENANVHRGIYTLSEQTTENYEAVREKTATFIGAQPDEIVFTKSATESANLLAFGLRKVLKKRDIIVVSDMEHHSNLVPWQIVAKQTGAQLRVLPITMQGTVDEKKALPLLRKAKVVALTHVSNATGHMLPVQRIARQSGGIVIIDGAQSVPHMPIDVNHLGCDALFFSAHKMLAPTGVGVLYAKRTLLKQLEPLLYGGNMIQEVSMQQSSFAEPPAKFEAGTPNVAGVIGFGAALDYLNSIGMKTIQQHEQELCKYAIKQLAAVPHIQLYTRQAKTGIVAFSLKRAHAHDVAALLDTYGIAVRAGHHCAMPLAKKLSYVASIRVSFYLYNTKAEVRVLVRALKKIAEVLCHD